MTRLRRGLPMTREGAHDLARYTAGALGRAYCVCTLKTEPEYYTVFSEEAMLFEGPGPWRFKTDWEIEATYRPREESEGKP